VPDNFNESLKQLVSQETGADLGADDLHPAEKNPQAMTRATIIILIRLLILLVTKIVIAKFGSKFLLS
jgi:hypothetical protein